MKLAGVMIGAEDSKVLGEFYNKVYGEDWQDGDWFGYNIGGSYLTIGPHSEVKGKSKEPARIMINCSTEDVKGDYKKLIDCGAKSIAEPYQPNVEKEPDGWIATVADPDGNYVQLMTPWKE